MMISITILFLECKIRTMLNRDDSVSMQNVFGLIVLFVTDSPDCWVSLAAPAVGAFVAEETAEPFAFKRRLAAATVAALKVQVPYRTAAMYLGQRIIRFHLPSTRNSSVFGINIIHFYTSSKRNVLLVLLDVHVLTLSSFELLRAIL